MTQAIINCTHVTCGAIRPGFDVWSTVRGASAGTAYDSIFRADNQWSTGDKYYLLRGGVQFDTSVIPSGALVSAANLRFPAGCSVVNNTSSMSFVLLSGMPTYPSNPVVYADFALSKYPDTVLRYSFTGMVWDSGNGWYEYDTSSSADAFYLTTTAQLAYIQKGAGAVTKFCLVTAYDADNTPPGGAVTNQHYFKSKGLINNDGVQLVVDYVLSPQVVRTDKPSSIS